MEENKSGFSIPVWFWIIVVLILVFWFFNLSNNSVKVAKWSVTDVYAGLESGKIEKLVISLGSNTVEVYLKNNELGLHTLFLLDIQGEYLMPAEEAAAYLIRQGLKRDTKCIACGGLGSDDPDIRYTTLDNVYINKFPQCLILPGKLHFKEEEALELFAKGV